MLVRAALILAVLLATPAGAQAYKPPRTAHGAPDLGGDWTSLSFTRLERPKALASLIVTEAEVAAWLKEERDRLVGIKPPPKPGEAPKPEDPTEVGDIESEWYELDGVGLARIDGQLRSSWIVEPPDGRLPYNSLGSTAVEAALEADEGDFRGPEVRMPDERCLIGYGSAAGPPMLNTTQNSSYKIVQTPGEIAILVEMIHDVRIIRLNAQHPPVRTHPWMGSSIGWWEGDTLVVETIDQNPGAANRILGKTTLHITPAARITERFTRISDKELRYDFVVDDPAVYTRPWRGEMIFSATSKPLYEYACHEGNYSLPNILGGGRAQDRAAAAAKAAP